jgi:hypothetical protein
MIAYLVTRGYATTTVLVTDIDAESDAEILDRAMATARETRSSLFGHRLSRDLNDVTRAVVSLYTD